MDVLALDPGFLAAGQVDDAGGPILGGGDAGQPGQAGSGGVALPAAPPPTRAGRAVGVDDHVAELAGETVGADQEAAPGHDATADARAERHHDQVRLAPPDAQSPLGQRRARGVVGHRDRPAQPVAEAGPDVELRHAGDVRRRDQHPVDGDQPGDADADRHAVGRSRGLGGQRGGGAFEGLDQTDGVVRGALAHLGHHLAGVVEGDAEDLRTADVEADRGPDGHASARIFSSRTVLRIRTSARRFTKPGSGAASSMARS